MKIHGALLGTAFLVSLAMAKTIVKPEPASKAAEKKVHVEEESKKLEATEAPAEIAIEDADEEPKQADRTKKAATTFCVEIRTGPSGATQKVCEERHPPHSASHQPFFPPSHQPSFPPSQQPSFPPSSNLKPQTTHAPQEIHEGFPPSHPSFGPEQEPQASIFMISPNSHVVHFHKESHEHRDNPQVPLSPSPQHIIIAPSSSGPCPPCPSTSNVVNPKTLISVFRSAMEPNDNAMPDTSMNSGADMRSSNSDDWITGMNSLPTSTNGMEAPNEIPYGLEALDTPFGRTAMNLYGNPPRLYYNLGADGYQRKIPYMVRYNPSRFGHGGVGGSMFVIPSGRFRDASEDSSMKNVENEPGNTEQSTSMDEPQTYLGGPQERMHHTIHPLILPIVHPMPGVSSLGFNNNPGVFQHSTSYQSYQAQQHPMHPMHPMHPHSLHSSNSGYSAQLHPNFMPPVINHFYRREGESPHKYGLFMRTSSNDMTIPQQESQQELQQQQVKENPCNDQAKKMERTSSSAQQWSQQPSVMSPSQMINQMKVTGPGSGSLSIQRTSPLMQSFPREREESPYKDGVHVKMHIPPGGQAFRINVPRKSRDEKSVDTQRSDVMRDESEKREAEKSAISEKDI